MESGDGFQDSAEDSRSGAAGEWGVTARVSMVEQRSWAGEAAWGGMWLGLRPLQAMMMAPAALFLGALTAMLLRPPDVPFYEIDRVAFLLVVVAVTVRAVA